MRRNDKWQVLRLYVEDVTERPRFEEVERDVGVRLEEGLKGKETLKQESIRSKRVNN